MSLLSRNTGGRRVATMAAVFVGTLLTYLVVAAVPALAVTACTPGPVAGSLQITTDPDDRIILTGSAAGWTVFEDGAAAATPGCTAATWVNITGSDAGQETVVLYTPRPMSDAAITINLGNGTDSLVLEYGDTTWNASGGAVPLGDPGTADAVGFGASGSNTVVNVNGFAGPGQPAPPAPASDAVGDVLSQSAENLTVNGGTGSDTIDAGNITDLTAKDLLATTSADNIPATTTPLGQNVTVNGEAGNDYFFSGNGNDVFNGAADFDTADFSGASAGVTVDLAAGTGTGQGSDALTDVQGVVGSAFADNLTGSAINNTISGGAGNDVIDGGLGNDIESGDAGDDTFNQGAAANGADTLSGGSGGPEVNGDTLNYGNRTGPVVVRPGAGAVSGADANADGDAADTGDENDTVGIDFEIYITGSGNDTLVGFTTGETFVPGAGNDAVTDTGGTDLLDLSGAAGAVTINLETGTATGEGNDTFGSGVPAGNVIEQFATGAGDDIVIPDITTGLPATFDWFAGAGIDMVDGSATTVGFTVDLSNLGGPTGCKAAFGLGLCTDVEDATGGSGNDTLQGSAISNVLIGGAGFDTIAAAGGNDFVEGGAGNDTLGGGTGADFLSYVNAPSGEVIDMQLGFASGGDGDDAIGFFEIVLGSDFNDQIIGGQTSLDANLRVRGRGGNDLITGTNSSDTLAGGGGNDVIRGGGGDDIVRGAAGNDRLFGSSGDDFLFGGRGFDVGRGGAGDDICRGVEDRRSC